MERNSRAFTATLCAFPDVFVQMVNTGIVKRALVASAIKRKIVLKRNVRAHKNNNKNFSIITSSI